LAGKTVASAVSNFGASAKAKLSNVAISGAPEDQLRGPLDALLHDLAEISGLPPKAINLVGETTLRRRDRLARTSPARANWRMGELSVACRVILVVRSRC
jgi:hypothetical protein